MKSLVLAGGGMRVAWQAGVMTALAEEGLEFSHVDGTSGGIINIGNDAAAFGINIGTGVADRTITVGSTSSGTTK